MNEMAKTIHIHMDKYKERIDNLKSAITSVDSTIHKSETFEKTNIEPFTNALRI